MPDVSDWIKGIDWPFWLYGLLAVAIAIVLSSAELLTRYRSRNLQEIFFSPYYSWFALLNAIFCFLVYWALPYFSNLVVKSELTLSLKEGLLRAIIAGLGYLVIARSSIIDITMPNGSTYGAGFDAIYTSAAEYLLDHHRRAMRRRTQNDFNRVFQAENNAERTVFLDAAQLVRAGLTPGEEQTTFMNRLNLANTNFPQRDPEYCLTIYLLMRDYTTNAQEVENRIRQQRP